MKSLFAALYGPVFWAGFIGAAACLIAVGQYSLWILPPLLLALLTSFLAERYLPYDGAWNHAHGDGWRDVLHALVNEVLYLPGLAAFPLLAGHLALGPFWPVQLPFWLQLLLAIVIADCGITLVHYLSHRYYFLWKLHAVHHSVQRLYGLNGWMKHPLHLLRRAGLSHAGRRPGHRQPSRLSRGLPAAIDRTVPRGRGRTRTRAAGRLAPGSQSRSVTCNWRKLRSARTPNRLRMVREKCAASATAAALTLPDSSASTWSSARCTRASASCSRGWAWSAAARLSSLGAPALLAAASKAAPLRRCGSA